MALEARVGKAVDGFICDTEAQCLAYELRLALLTLSKSLDGKMNINQFGQIDADAVEALAREVIEDLRNQLTRVQLAMGAFAQKAGGNGK